MTSVAIIGVGKIVEAFLRGYKKNPQGADHTITLVGKNEAHNQQLANKWELPTSGLSAALTSHEYVIIAVKPKDYETLLSSFTTVEPVIISFASGISTHYIEETLSGVGAAKVIRAMPNTPMEINQGSIAVTAGSHVSPAELETAQQLLSLTADTYVIPESLHPAFTALAGSGPAYVYLVAEALTDAAVAQGLPRELAAQLSAQTLLGSAGMLKEYPDQAAQLRAQVTSPGGTTAAAVEQLEAAGMRAAFYRAIAAAHAKANH